MKLTYEMRGQQAVVDFLSRFGTDVQQGASRLINRAALAIQRDARRAAPVDTGNLRAKILLVFSKGGDAVDIVADAPYARGVEEGTGTPAGHAAFRAQPPPGALADWARRHQIPEYVVARAIFRRGGIPPRPFLMPAFQRHSADLFVKLEQLVRRTAGVS